MKIMKRIATMILSIVLTVPLFSSVVTAAGDGVIFFSDLETSVGATFTVTGTVASRVGNVGDVTVQMRYDTAFMQFMSGDGVTADGSGNLTFTGTGNGSKLEFSMEFQALQEGSTRIEQGSATVYDSSGNVLECDPGYADIAVGPGDPGLITQQAASGDVAVNGQSYRITGDFSVSMIPEGFSEGEFTYNDATFRGAVQPNAGIVLAYLTDEAGSSDFWVYESEEASFTPCEEMMISDTYSILIMDGTKVFSLPEEYTESVIQISGKEIPAWIDPNREGFSVLYGVNSDGDTSLYSFDTLEHTFQRMETPKAAVEESEDKGTTAGVWANVESFVTEYMLWVVVGAACVLVILLIFLLVLLIKLGRRNRELDDLYDEYGIDEEPTRPQKKVEKRSRREEPEEEYVDEEDYFDDSDEYYDDGDYEGYDDDDYDDDLSDLKDDFKSYSHSQTSYDEYYDEDDFEDEPVQKSSRRKKNAREDTFEMDFIDLD